MSSMIIKSFQKTVVERRRLYMDYSCWLEAVEEITAFQVNITPYTEGAALVVDTSYVDVAHKKLAMYVSGGKANIGYTLGMIVTTDAGQVKRDDIGVKVVA